MTRSRRVNAQQKCSQLCRRMELRNGIQLLERRRERVRKAPHGPRRELLMLWIEVAIMHDAGQVPGYLKFSFDERSIDDELFRFIRKLACAPGFNLPAHRFEVSLHAVDACREDVHEAQVLGVLGEHRCERARDNVSELGPQPFLGCFVSY